MKPEELNQLMTDVTRQLDEAGCEYLLTVVSNDGESTLGSASMTLTDTKTAATVLCQCLSREKNKLFALTSLIYSIASNVDIKSCDLPSALQSVVKFPEPELPTSTKGLRL